MVPDMSAAATRREGVSITIDGKGSKPTVEVLCKVVVETDAGATAKGLSRDTSHANDSVSSSPAGSVVAKFDAEIPSPVTTPGVMSEEKSQQVPFKVNACSLYTSLCLFPVPGVPSTTGFKSQFPAPCGSPIAYTTHRLGCLHVSLGTNPVAPDCRCEAEAVFLSIEFFADMSLHPHVHDPRDPFPTPLLGWRWRDRWGVCEGLGKRDLKSEGKRPNRQGLYLPNLTQAVFATKQVLLTQEQAIEIYKVRPMDSSPNTRPTSIEVAEQYGVSPKTVRDVWNRKTWVKVTRPLWAPAELEAYLSESVRRGPGGRQPSPHGEGDEENEDGRSRRPVRESRNNKRQLLSPPEEATVARAAPRKSSSKKLKLPAGVSSSSPKRAKNSPSAAPSAFGDMSALGQQPPAASPAPKARIAGPRVKKADMAVYMPYDLMVPGQMQQAEDMGDNYATVERQEYNQEHAQEPNSWDAEWQSQTDMLDDGCSPLQEKFDFESSPCNVDYVGPIGGCYGGYGGDVLSSNDLDLAWCK